jgi:hypothetical protein
MARMVRKQVYIEARQDAALKRRANELGVTEAELIRRGIDETLGGDGEQARRLQIWEEEKAWIRKNRKMDVPQTGRGWTREDIYEERIRRFID